MMVLLVLSIACLLALLLVSLLVLRIVIVARTIQNNRQYAMSSIQSSSSSSSSFFPSSTDRSTTTTKYNNYPIKQVLHPSSTITTTVPLRTLIVLGSGGHTSEILYMTQYLNHPSSTNNIDTLCSNNVVFEPIDYCKASTDSTSQDRLYHHQMLKNKATSSSNTKQMEIYNIPRSREVGQSYWSSIYTTLVAIIYSMKLVYTLRPNIVLCNGPGTCIPICIITYWYRILNILPNHQTYIIFMESFCRVQTLSLSGKILYSSSLLTPLLQYVPVLPVADLFIVHWEELQDKFPNTIRTNTYI
jgi:beta-1,4-N-acetylglucosaminyltransferase